MSMYDEYVDSRNEAIVDALNKFSKKDIIKMIIDNSNDDYLGGESGLALNADGYIVYLLTFCEPCGIFRSCVACGYEDRTSTIAISSTTEGFTTKINQVR